MMKRKFVALLTAGLMTIGAGCAVFAEDVDFSAVNTVIKGQLTVGTEAGFAPYEYMVGDEVVGIDMDIAAKIAEILGCTPEEAAALTMENGRRLFGL